MSSSCNRGGGGLVGVGSTLVVTAALSLLSLNEVLAQPATMDNVLRAWPDAGPTLSSGMSQRLLPSLHWL